MKFCLEKALLSSICPGVWMQLCDNSGMKPNFGPLAHLFTLSNGTPRQSSELELFAQVGERR